MHYLPNTDYGTNPKQSTFGQPAGRIDNASSAIEAFFDMVGEVIVEFFALLFGW